MPALLETTVLQPHVAQTTNKTLSPSQGQAVSVGRQIIRNLPTITEHAGATVAGVKGIFSTLTPPLSAVADDLATYLSFNGSTTLVDLGSPAVIPDGSGAVSFAAWIRPQTTGAVQVIVGNRNGPSFRGWAFTIDTALELSFGFYDTGGSQHSFGGIPALALTSGRLTHVGVSFDGTVCRFYIDGVENVRPSIGGTTLSAGPDNVQIGHRPAASTAEYFPGLMRDVRLYTRTLTTAEYPELAANRTVSSTSLVGWYPLNEGSGSTADDDGTNDLNGTITDGSWTTARRVGLGRSILVTKSLTEATSLTFVRSQPRFYTLAQGKSVSLARSYAYNKVLLAQAHAGSGGTGTVNPKTLTTTALTVVTTLGAIRAVNTTLTTTPIVSVATMGRTKALTLSVGSQLALPPVSYGQIAVVSLVAVHGPVLLAQSTVVPVMRRTVGFAELVNVNALGLLTSQKAVASKVFTLTQAQMATLTEQAAKVLLAVQPTQVSKTLALAKALTATQGNLVTIVPGRRFAFLLQAPQTSGASFTYAIVGSPGPLLIVPHIPPGSLTLIPEGHTVLVFQPLVPSSR